MSKAYRSEHAIVEPALRGFRASLLAVPDKVRDKGGDLGPLTEIDLMMNERIYAAVHSAFPGDGWISEESPHESGNGRYFVVDPVDGTRELVAGIPEWCVSVGLWQDGRPLYGWLYHAPSDVLWHGGPGIGAWSNDRPVRVRRPAALKDVVVGVSRTDIKKGLVPKTDPAPKGIGSIAYKLGLVGAGDIDATVSVTPKNIWDIAGGIALVLGAGGAVLRCDDGRPIDRIADMHALVEGGLVAAHPDWVEAVRNLYV